MPNRWIKADILSSERWNSVSAEAQSLYVRLLLVADDHGRFDGRPAIVESACYPLRTLARSCVQLLAELEAVDLIRGYNPAPSPGVMTDSKRVFILIPRFYERPRSKSRFPDPPEELLSEQGRTHLFASACKCELSTSTTHDHDHDHDHGCDHPPAGVARAPRKPKPEAETPPTRAAWEAYRGAYFQRYGAEPVRNATVNGQMANFVSRVGAEDAPHVAAFYLRHNNAWYVKKGHAVGIMVADAEKLRTEWATRRAITDTEARQADRTQSTANAFAPLLAEAAARERTAHEAD